MNLSSLDQIQFKWKTSLMNSISVPSGQPSTCNVGPSSTSSPSLSQSHSLPHTSNFPLTLQTSKTLKDSSFSLRLFPSLYLSLLLSLFSNTLQTLSDPPRHSHATLPLYTVIFVFWVALLVGIWVLVRSGSTSITSNDFFSLHSI